MSNQHVPDAHDTSVERFTPVVRRLVLLRHGQTQYNADSRMQGQLDTELTDRGRSQAAYAAQALADRQPLRIISSDLRRARDTAEALSGTTGVTVDIDKRLRETALGEWEGKTHLEVDEYMPGARQSWRNAPRWAPPGGESKVDVAHRTTELVNELVTHETDWGTSERPIILVAHGGTIATLTAALMGLPIDLWTLLGGLGNCSWVQISGHGDDVTWRLDVWNGSADGDAPEVVPRDVL